MSEIPKATSQGPTINPTDHKAQAKEIDKLGDVVFNVAKMNSALGFMLAASCDDDFKLSGFDRDGIALINSLLSEKLLSVFSALSELAEEVENDQI